MKKILITTIIFFLIFISRYFIFKKELKSPNPMEYTYNYPIDDVRKKMSDRFSNNKFLKLQYVVGYNSIEKEIGKISDVENKNNIFLSPWGYVTTGKSEVYFNWWGRLELYPSYHIILDSVTSNKTNIRIESYPKVIAGTTFETNHGIPYLTPYKREVKPSTVEEYEILKKIGDDLGQKSMPPLVQASR